MSDAKIDADDPIIRLAIRVGEGIAMKTKKPRMTDVTIIIAIAEVIVEIIKLIKQCQDSSQKRLILMRSPGLIARWRLKRVTHKHADGKSDLGKYLPDELIAVAKSASDEELNALFSAIEG